MHRLQVGVRDGPEADHLRQGAAGRGDRICRRGCRHLPAPVAAAEAAHGGRRGDRRVRDGRPAAGGDGRADGVARDQGRSRLSGQIVGHLRDRDRPAGGPGLRGRRRAVHHRSPAATRQRVVRPAGPEGRAQGQERDLFDRRDRAGAACRRRRAGGAAGAGMAPTDEAEEHLHRRVAGADQPRDGAGPHQLQPVGRADRAIVVDRAQSAEHPDPHRDRPPDPRCLRRRAAAMC